MAERDKPQWQALSVMLVFAAILGGLAFDIGLVKDDDAD
jgi:hypothetical protein